MADPTEDAARSSVDASSAGIRCPLLVIVAADGASAAGQADLVSTAAVEPAPGEPAPGEPSRPEARLDLPSTANRCGASQLAIPVSLSQQRLVCFDGAYVDCPRFVRATGSTRGGSGRPNRPAAVVPIAVASIQPAAETTTSPAGAADSTPTDEASAPIAPATPAIRSSRRSGARPATSRSRPIIVASAILIGALVIAFAFTSYRGGLAMPSAPASAAAAGTPAGPASAESPIASLVASPTEAASPSPSVSSSASPSPSPSPTPTATPGASPSASVPPAYQGLKPCPDAPDCYLYRIHSGDNLTAIAQRFGITIVALKAANPEIKDPSLLHVGEKIRVPLPTS